MMNENITKKGEIEVVNQLKNAGWNVQDWDPSAEGSKDIVASASGKKIMVQVKTAVSPNDPPNLTRPEVETMAARARQLNAEGFQARVKFDPAMNRLGNIFWKRLF